MNNLGKKCGFVAVLGLPNAGKSTLINEIVGYKVSIVSPKVQTTMQRILGIAIYQNTQIILVDTPGIFSAKKNSDKIAVDIAWSASKSADLNLFLIDANSREFDSSKKMLEQLPTYTPLFLVLNKIDLVDKRKLLEIVEKFKELPHITQIFMISALKKNLKNNGVFDLINAITTLLPNSDWLYPEDSITDLPEKVWAAEITREQLYLNLKNELPYETSVKSETWEEFKDGSVKIRQIIEVDKIGQKAIILGKNGAMIKLIGQKSRQQLEKLLERKVHLFLFVKLKSA